MSTINEATVREAARNILLTEQGINVTYHVMRWLSTRPHAKCRDLFDYAGTIDPSATTYVIALRAIGMIEHNESDCTNLWVGPTITADMPMAARN